MLKFKLKSIAALLCVLFFGLQVLAINDEYRKTYQETFQVNSDALLEISNKYGFVKIITGDVNEIVVNVVVTIEEKSMDRAQKQLDKINISLTGDASGVAAITTIEKGGKFKELNIDYTVTMPVSGNLDLTNKFGNSYINEINGATKIYQAYGTLDVGSLNSKKNDVTVKFGSGKIKYAHYMDYVSRYSEVRVSKAKLLNLDAQYGDVKVGEVGRLNLESQYGDVSLGTIVELTAKLQFGDLDVEGIMKDFDLNAQYGDTEIEFISKDFENITVISSFGDVELAFQSGSNFTLKGKASFGDITIPSGTSKDVSNNAGNDVYNGKLFEGTAPSVVEIRMSYGDVDISIN